MYTPEHRAEVSSTLGLAIVIYFLGIVTSRGHAHRELRSLLRLVP